MLRRLIRFILKNREQVEREEREKQINSIENKDRATIIFDALGGKENIVSIDSCITRLRVELKNSDFIRKIPIRKVSMGILVIGNHGVQIIVGKESEEIGNYIQEMLK